MKKTIVFSTSLESECGDVARVCSLVLGPARLEKILVDTLFSESSDAIFLCICADDAEGVSDLLHFIDREGDSFTSRIAGVLCCATDIDRARDTLATFLDNCSSYSVLTSIISLPLQLENVVGFAVAVRRSINDADAQAPREVVKEELDAFLHTHNTCTLCTAYDNRVRGTPIEYFLNEDTMYFLSEGGVKFANILLNSEVSISIYDPYHGMGNLGGLQLTGTAQIVDPACEEYQETIDRRGLTKQLARLDFTMNLIKVTFTRAEFLYSKFQQMGFGAKQSFNY
ncbi:MAG TPA: pyridoxamine 5'-phosphate oxidase family protein [Candidatus Lokiarchaeia archaeon]|nr:pyridoxamine 5'-phosphate oxidase family protein [Candidatus Lokiarchaeia archaeon]